MLERIPAKIPKIGVFAVAHGTYWSQFPGLKDNMEGYHADLISLIGENKVEIVDLGIVDSSEDGFLAADRFNAENVDLIFCNMITYATSSVFAPVLRNCSAPMVLVALQPKSAMDYERANTFMQLENDNICSVPEFTGVAIRLGKPVSDVIIGISTLDLAEHVAHFIRQVVQIFLRKTHLLHSLVDLRNAQTSGTFQTISLIQCNTIFNFGNKHHCNILFASCA